MELGERECRASTHLAIVFQCGGEVLGRALVVTHRGGREREEVIDRSAAGLRERPDDRATAQREQQLVEQRSMRPVLDGRGGLDERGHADQPRALGRKPIRASAQRDVELDARVVEPTHLGVDGRERAAGCGEMSVGVETATHRGFDLVRPPLPHAQLHQRGPEQEERQVGLDLMTAAERRRHQLLTLGESATHHCAHRGAHLGDPLPERLAQLVGESSTYSKLALHRGHVAELAVVVSEEVVTEDGQLSIVRTFAERAQLVACRDAFVHVGRRPSDDVPDVQRARERSAVARPPRRLDRGGRELPPAVDGGSEQQGVGQTRHHACPDGFVIVNGSPRAPPRAGR